MTTGAALSEGAAGMALSDTEPSRESASPVLSIVMPVYNEEAVLGAVIEEALDAGAATRLSYELVLLDDASVDGSLAILREYQARHPAVIRVLSNASNRGIILACDQLYKAARGRYIFVNSSDGQWNCSEVVHMLGGIERFDLIVGRRGHKRYGLRRRLISGLFNLLPRLLFGVQTYDAGSIKVFRREVLEIPLLSRSPFREAERIIRATQLGYRVGAVHVNHHDRRGGKATGARWRLVVHSLLDLWRCWWDVHAQGTHRMHEQESVAP